MMYSKISAPYTDITNGNKISIVLTHYRKNFVLVLKLRQKLSAVLLRQMEMKNCQRLYTALIISILFLWGDLGSTEPQSIPKSPISVKV